MSLDNFDTELSPNFEISNREPIPGDTVNISCTSTDERFDDSGSWLQELYVWYKASPEDIDSFTFERLSTRAATMADYDFTFEDSGVYLFTCGFAYGGDWWNAEGDFIQITTQ